MSEIPPIVNAAEAALISLHDTLPPFSGGRMCQDSSGAVSQWEHLRTWDVRDHLFSGKGAMLFTSGTPF